MSAFVTFCEGLHATRAPRDTRMDHCHSLMQDTLYTKHHHTIIPPPLYHKHAHLILGPFLPRLTVPLAP